jgi:hypothetical protein
MKKQLAKSAGWREGCPGNGLVWVPSVREAKARKGLETLEAVGMWAGP